MCVCNPIRKDDGGSLRIIPLQAKRQASRGVYKVQVCRSFSFGEVGTFALFELPMFMWGTLIKMKVIYLKCYKV